MRIRHQCEKPPAVARIGKYVAESQPRQSYEPGIEQADQSKMHRLAQPKIRQTRKDNVIFLINTVGPSGKYERYKKLQNDIFPHTTPCVAFSRDGCLSIETRSRKCVRTSEETIVAGISPSGSLGTPFPLPRVCRDVRRRGGGGGHTLTSEPIFLASIGYQIFLPMVLRGRASRSGALLRRRERGRRAPQ